MFLVHKRWSERGVGVSFYSEQRRQRTARSLAHVKVVLFFYAAQEKATSPHKCLAPPYSNDIYNPQPVLKIVPGQTQWGLFGYGGGRINVRSAGWGGFAKTNHNVFCRCTTKKKKGNQSCMVITVPNSDLSSPS